MHAQGSKGKKLVQLINQEDRKALWFQKEQVEVARKWELLVQDEIADDYQAKVGHNKHQQEQVDEKFDDEDWVRSGLLKNTPINAAKMPVWGLMDVSAPVDHASNDLLVVVDEAYQEDTWLQKHKYENWNEK